jgi:light-regulated signal transduction histidine kinase (bacteriophytochrome)
MLLPIPLPTTCKVQLSLITGFADLLYKPTVLPTKRQETIHHCQNAHKMSSIIDELLLLASVRQKEVKLKPLNMKAIVHEAMQRLRYTQANNLWGKITAQLMATALGLWSLG